MGLMALLWPLSLPARAILASSKAGRLMERGAWASLEDETLYLHAENEQGGVKMRLSTVRRVESRRGFLVLVMARGDFVALPLDALPREFVSAIGEWVKTNNLAKFSSED